MPTGLTPSTASQIGTSCCWSKVPGVSHGTSRNGRWPVGAGSARRSTLAFAFSGSASSVTYADGTMKDGRRPARRRRMALTVGPGGTAGTM